MTYELNVHRANDSNVGPLTQVIGNLALIKDSVKAGRIDLEKGVEYAVSLAENTNNGYANVLLQVTADAEAVEFLLRRKVRSLGKDAPAPAPIEDAPEAAQAPTPIEDGSVQYDTNDSRY